MVGTYGNCCSHMFLAVSLEIPTGTLEIFTAGHMRQLLGTGMLEAFTDTLQAYPAAAGSCIAEQLNSHSIFRLVLHIVHESW